MVTTTSSFVASISTTISGTMCAPCLPTYFSCTITIAQGFTYQGPPHLTTPAWNGHETPQSRRKGIWHWAPQNCLKAPPLHHFVLQLLDQTYPRMFELCVCVQLWEIICVFCMESSFSTLQCCTLCYSIMWHAKLTLLYHASILTLQKSIIPHALELPHAWYYKV